MPNIQPPHIAYFSDVLCVWAYTAQIRLDELKRRFGEQIRLSYHFIPVFGCTEQRVAEGWRDQGGYGAFGEHVRSVCSQFPHVPVNDRVWQGDVPASSSSSHLFLKAVQLLEQRGLVSPAPQARFDGRSCFEELTWRLRLAFFRDARNVSDLDCLLELAEQLSLPLAEIRSLIDRGEAMAALCRDIELRDEFKVEGSPSYVLNEGRQKLYGNVGYKVIAANVEELLDRPEGQASWC